MQVLIALWCVAALFALAALGIAVGRWRAGARLIYLATFLVAATVFLAGLNLLLTAAPAAEKVLPLGLPWLGTHLRLDALSAFFLIVIGLGGAAASLYGVGYGSHEPAPLRVVPFFPAFLAAMVLVVLADDAFTFLLCWEFMSLVSWAMVAAHHREAGNTRAANIYLVMASFGTMCLLLAFGLLAGADGEYTFAAIRGVDHDAAVAGLVTMLVLVGAGSKAGLVPLHVWLPLAHPAAPSHVSALLSGVMTKIGIYGFVRIVFDLVEAPAAWSSMVVLALGGITAVLGVLYAVMQQDLKRLLAYSTVENIGIVFAGLGLALAFQASGLKWAAALALTAALLHVFNHALFKSLLFFGAGAVLSATGERDMERLGGLIHRMPQTAVAFLTGCLAIAALPPLNGFVSEWLIFQAILVSPHIPHLGLKFLIPAVGALLALAAALAAACFVKAFGITFLGRPRGPGAESAREVDLFSLNAMFALAALCLVIGVLPGLFIDLLAPTVATLLDARMPVQKALPWLSIVPIAESRSSYNGAVIFAFLLVSGTLTATVIHRRATRATRRSAIWDCGYPTAATTTQYSGSSFAQPIRRVFGQVLFNVHERVDMPAPGDLRPARFRLKVFDPAWRFAYGPLTRAVWGAALRLNALQFLTIRRYLTLVFVALILLLLVVAAWR